MRYSCGTQARKCRYCGGGVGREGGSRGRDRAFVRILQAVVRLLQACSSLRLHAWWGRSVKRRRLCTACRPQTRVFNPLFLILRVLSLRVHLLADKTGDVVDIYTSAYAKTQPKRMVGGWVEAGGLVGAKRRRVHVQSLLCDMYHLPPG